jgi:hypothetical protein
MWVCLTIDGETQARITAYEGTFGTGRKMGSFGILILDKNDTGREQLWYVTASALRPDDLKRITSHDDTIVMHLMKSLYPAILISQVSLTNTHTGTSDPGKIYEVRHV